MALNPLAVLMFPLQEQIVNKDDGTPLAGGVVTFYSDSNRTIFGLKPVYTLNQNGAYSNASYVELPNPLILSSIGTFVDDNGNDIIPYMFPYEGTPSDSNGIVDLYYITVESSAGVLQFTRSAWPNTTSGLVPGVNEIVNYIPNGQFLLHNNFPVTTNITTAVPASADVTEIAQGGWSFQVPHGTSSVNTVTFIRQNSASNNPDESANPRYVVNIQCTSASNTDTFKDLCIKFPDVNKFTSSSSEANYTFSFQGLNSSLDMNVQIRLLKYFGTGGSPEASSDMPFGTGELTIKNVDSIYQIAGIFGDNSGLNLGTNDDDYLQIAIRFPNTTFNVELTDFLLTDGEVVIEGFPQTPNAKMIDESVAGWLPTPDPDGFDLYLPMVLTPTGATFSDADIGKIYAAMYLTLPIGELDCNGTQYLTEGYSTDGIPYARLQAKWFDNTNLINYFGNGANYMAATFTNLTPGSSTFILNMTSLGAATFADFNTTFTFVSICSGRTTGCVGYIDGAVTVIDNTIGTRTAPTAGTSGFTVTVLRNTSNSYHMFVVDNTPTVTAGTYFTFTTGSGLFYMWFKVDGSGSDPAPGGTGIQVNMLSTYTEKEVARCIKDAITGTQASQVTPLAGSSVVQNSYFIATTFAASAFYVWYNVNNAGTDPLPLIAAANKIEVDILSTDTAAIVTTKTISAINMKYFATPDLRAQFLRGWDAGAGIDLDVGLRITQNNYFLNNLLGSFETDQFFTHLHANTASSSSTAVPFLGNTAIVQNNAGSADGTLATPTGGGIDLNHTIGITTTTTMTNASTGGTETRPYNVYVRWVTKY